MAIAAQNRYDLKTAAVPGRGALSTTLADEGRRSNHEKTLQGNPDDCRPAHGGLRTMAPDLALKRAYEEASPSDGCRALSRNTMMTVNISNKKATRGMIEIGRASCRERV